ncbi:MAG: PD-(D/E)XK nuclease family protein [Spirochaetes bacterium]|jgi:hypothetical protein|nr:PD-(D/E)XK nuclease family protein [Spirochaetota bacterium]
MRQLSFSKINYFKKCGAKYRLRYIEKIKPETTPDYMSVGRMVDNALVLANEKNASFDDVIRNGEITFDDQKWYYYCKGIYDNRKELYKKVFGDDQVKLQQKISMPIIDPETGETIDAEMIGYLDGESKVKAKIYEIKTASQVSENTLQEYEFGGQTQLYSFAKKEEFGMYPEVEYVFVKKPMIRLKKSETQEEFYQRMYECGFEQEVQTFTVHYSEAQILETVDYFFKSIKDLEVAEKNNHFYLNRNECFQYGNKCEYFDMCWKNAVETESA